MTTSTDLYNANAGQARQATERSVVVVKNAAQTLTNQLDAVKLPAVDLTQPVTRYFEFVQKSVDLNRELATRWAELVTTLSGTVRQQAEKVTGIVKDQTNTVADLTVKQAEKAEQAERERAQEAEEAEKAKALEAKRVEREEAEKAQQQAEEAEEAEKAKALEAKRIEREETRKAEEAEEAEKARVREAKRIEREEAKKAQEKARQAYDGLTKAELSEQLAGRGLPKTGNIADLIERLVSADSQ